MSFCSYSCFWSLGWASLTQGRIFFSRFKDSVSKMPYLVHKLSPMRDTVFLVEIYHPVSLNAPKWPLLKSQIRWTVTFSWTLTLLSQCDGFRLTPWILPLVFSHILIQSANRGKFHNRAVYSLVPKRTQYLPGCGLSQYKFWDDLSPSSSFLLGFKAPFSKSYLIDFSLKILAAWRCLLTRLICSPDQLRRLEVDVDPSTLFGISATHPGVLAAIKNTGTAANRRKATTIAKMALGVPLSSSNVTEITFDLSFA